MEPKPADSSLQSPEATALASVTFETLTFSDGTVIRLDSDDIVVLVGPNNSGKSAALRELEEHIGPPRSQVVIKSVTLRKTGNAAQLRELLKAHSRMSGDESALQFAGYRYNIRNLKLEQYWENNLEPFRPLFCQRIATETRITDSNQQPAIATLDQHPTHPIHLLFSDDQIAQRMSGYFKRAFGMDLIVYHLGGQNWPLLTGGRPNFLTGEDRISAAYNERLRDQTIPLQQQGDGMRSFASVILHMLAPSTQTVMLLDEPEAFLHPPQARLLGEFIAMEKPARAQLFIATHSSDVLQGLLGAVPQHLRVLRIQREANVNRVKELDKARAKEISADPLMKFSSVLSGIFYQRVVIGEADADCMFYSTILDLPKVHGTQRPDVLFLHTGGKSRMAKLANSLRALDVNVDVVADLDVLNDLSELKKIVEALGGNWPKIEALANPLKTAIDQHKPWLKSSEVANEIRKTLKDVPPDGEFPKKAREQILLVFRKASPWDAIKEGGMAAIPSGQPTQQFQELQKLCNACGLWIVPVGELEGFCKSVGNHGTKWVQEVLETRDLANDPELEPARTFIRELWNSRDAKPHFS